MKSLDLHVGDCLESLRALPDGCVNTCVTSPPYFGLRDYGMEGQIGLEETPDAFVAKLVEVFREVRRVLRDDGTLWLNLGDSYGRGKRVLWHGDAARDHNGVHTSVIAAGGYGTGAVLPDKNLIGIPWRVAFALQADGWYLRQDIIWHKPNPMPESVRDRCTKAHEYIFLLSKRPRYYFDADAIKEPAVATHAGEMDGGAQRLATGADANEGRAWRGREDVVLIRNRRSVWTVATKPYSGAHFATFPPDLIEPCILAGAPEGGTVLDPFGGSGTTAGVALAKGRKAILCELNPAYAKLIPARVHSIMDEMGQMDLFGTEQVRNVKSEKPQNQGETDAAKSDTCAPYPRNTAARGDH